MSLQLVTDRQPVDKTLTWLAVAITVVTLGYTLPWLIAQARGKANVGSVAVINVVLGWTIVGWWVALVMALMPHRAVTAVQRPALAAAPGWYPTPGGTRYWNGSSWA